MAAPTLAELFDSFKAEAQDRRPDLTFDDGDITEMFAFGGAAMADHITGWLAQRIAETYLDGARGETLTRLADDHWNIQRREASYAFGDLSFNRATAAAGAGTIAAGFVVATVKDPLGREIQVTTDADVSYGALETGAKIVACTARVAGVGGNVAANQLTVIKDTLFDSTITVNNPAAIAGGAEAEGDDELRARVRDFSATVRRATLAALEYGAKQVSGVANATAVESATGIVSLYVSDSSGSSNPTMIANVTTEIANWRAAGVLVQVFGGTVTNIAIVVAVTARTGVNTTALVANIKSAIVAKVNKLKIGEKLYHQQIRDAVASVDPDGIADVVVTTPALDLQPAATELIRTNAGLITVT
jgi:uncharacterized phage protein gp47/JayE